MPVYHALIRTHHITSRKKVARLKAAAKQLQCYALIRSGGVPGAIYVRGENQSQVQQWVDTVHGLRYKNYQLSVAVEAASGSDQYNLFKSGILEEVESVKEMGARMETAGLQKFWRAAMGFVHE